MAEELGSAVLRLAVELDTATLGSATQAITRSTEQAGRAAGVALGGGLRAGLQQSAVESRRLAQELAKTFREAGTQSGKAFGGGFRTSLLKSVNEAQQAAAARQVQPVEGTGRVLGGGIVSAVTRQREEYEAAARAGERLLQIDLRRAQILRSTTQGGFGAASEVGFRGPGTTDPIQKSIERNRRKRAAAEERRLRQEDALDADLQRVRQRRIKEEDDDRKRKKEQRDAADKRARRQQDILSNAIIGGAFPALFGQGLGASLGGALGGAGGGALGGQFGFGLSLIGTAVGAQFDLALQKAQTLAQGLDNPIKNFGALREAALLSSRALEKQVEVLIASGRATEAEILLRQDLTNIFGSAEGAQSYQKTIDDLNRSFAQGTTVVASFVAGPLTRIIRAFSEPLQEAQLGSTFVRRAAALPQNQQEQIRQFRNQLVEQFPTATRAEIYLKLLQEIDRITGQAAKSEKDLLAVRTATARAQQTEGKLVVQRALGLEGLAASTELQNIRARQNQIIPGFTGLRPGQQETAAGRLDPERLKELNELRKEEITALIQLLRLDTERAQRNADLARSIANVNQLLATQPGIARDTLRFTQGTSKALLDAARAQDRNLQAIKFAQGQLGEPTAANAGDRKRLLSEERQARLEYIDAANQIRLSLFEAAERLSNTFRESALRFTEIRSSAGGLNRFLNAGQRQERAAQDFNLLLPFFRQAQERFRGLTGVQAPEFRGTTEGVNASIRDFINAVNQEFQARQDLAGAQQSLTVVNENLANVNYQLVAATQALASKNWTVEVQVNNQAGGATTVNAVNALAQ